MLTAILYFHNRRAVQPLEKELYVLTLGLVIFGILQLIAGLFQRAKSTNGFAEIMDDLNFLPNTMKKLAIVQFFTWFALFAMWIYSTPALAQHIHGTTDPTSPEYNKIANWVGVLFGWYNGFAALLAFLLPVLAKRFSRPATHAISLVAGGLGLISYYFFKNEYMLIISMAGVGLAWCSTLAMPYAMLTQSLPSHKMGVYMGIFNFFIVLPEILASVAFKPIMRDVLHNNRMLAIQLGGGLLLLAAIITLLLVKEQSRKDDVLATELEIEERRSV